MSIINQQFDRNLLETYKFEQCSLSFFYIDDPNTIRFNTTKQEVEQNLKSKKFKAEDNVKGASDFWKSYQYISDEDGHLTDHIRCRFCGRVDKYEPKSGTKHLLAHYKICNPLTKSASIDQYFTKKEIYVTNDEKTMLTRTALEMCYKDLRPFRAIEGRGLMSLLLAVSKLTSKYGLLSEETLRRMLPCDRTVSIFFH